MNFKFDYKYFKKELNFKGKLLYLFSYITKKKIEAKYNYYKKSSSYFKSLYINKDLERLKKEKELFKEWLKRKQECYPDNCYCFTPQMIKDVLEMCEKKAKKI